MAIGGVGADSLSDAGGAPKSSSGNCASDKEACRRDRTDELFLTTFDDRLREEVEGCFVSSPALDDFEGLAVGEGR